MTTLKARAFRGLFKGKFISCPRKSLTRSHRRNFSGSLAGYVFVLLLDHLFLHSILGDAHSLGKMYSCMLLAALNPWSYHVARDGLYVTRVGRYDGLMSRATLVVCHQNDAPRWVEEFRSRTRGARVFYAQNDALSQRFSLLEALEADFVVMSVSLWTQPRCWVPPEFSRDTFHRVWAPGSNVEALNTKEFRLRSLWWHRVIVHEGNAGGPTGAIRGFHSTFKVCVLLTCPCVASL